MAGRERDDRPARADRRDADPDADGGRSESDAERHRPKSDGERVERIRERARRRWVPEGAADAPRPDELSVAVGRLDSDAADERARAAWSLAELAAQNPDRSWRLPVESKLAPLLDDEDPWVRRGASWAVATVADDHPQRARAVVPTVTRGLADDDPLVRENCILAVAGVAREYPLAVEPALRKLAEVVEEDDGLARRYAAETLRRLVTRLDEDGFPRTIAATPEIAEVLSGDASVVEVTDDPSAGMPVRVRDSGRRSTEREDAAGGDGRDEREEDDRALGPPDRIPDPPGVDAARSDFERLTDLGGDPLTTAVKARAPSRGDGGQHVVVAVRTLRSGLAVDPARVERAFRAWARVDDHDHVLPVVARGSTPRPWLATEFADGGTLRDHLGSVGFDRALWYAHRVTAAVSHAHARGVVHGALWPGAVGLARALGAWPVPKVGDWGFGELLAEVRDPPVPPAYAAPEHVAPGQFGRPDHATDVYQLGALCYALFAGRPPFVGQTAEIAEKVRNERPAPPSGFAEGVPEAIDDLLARALTKPKPARFETAEDFRRELEGIVAEFGPETP